MRSKQEAVSERVRTPAVAGLFYPGEAEVLRENVRRLLRDNPATGAAPKAVIVPHAGYVYSGPVAARAYNLVAQAATRIRRVLLMGPAHRVMLRGMALPKTAAFHTPLGDISLDTAAMAEIEGTHGVLRSDEAHRLEHSLEVQLPFLQTVLGEFTLVPLVVGWTEPAEVAAVLEQLWGGDETLVVLSSDLSHYHAYAEARRLDEETARRIESQSSEIDGEQACGAHPLNGLLELSRRRRLGVTRLDLRNSGDTAGGHGRVVGYGAWSLGAI